MHALGRPRPVHNYLSLTRPAHLLSPHLAGLSSFFSSPSPSSPGRDILSFLHPSSSSSSSFSRAAGWEQATTLLYCYSLIHANCVTRRRLCLRSSTLPSDPYLSETSTEIAVQFIDNHPISSPIAFATPNRSLFDSTPYFQHCTLPASSIY